MNRDWWFDLDGEKHPHRPDTRAQPLTLASVQGTALILTTYSQVPARASVADPQHCLPRTS